MRPRTFKKLISGALVALVFGSLWFFFAPVSLGGSSSWVVTDGISMEPRFHAGDLALVRAQSEYHVGEIVAYQNRQLHTVVLHRIIGREGSRFIFKGDNNNFVDFEHPAKSQLIGSLWLHLAGVGGRLESVHSPLLIGGLAALATFLFAAGAFTNRRRLRRRRRRAATAAPAGAPTRGPRPHAQQLAVLACGVIALLPFASLAVLGFTRPASAQLQTQLPYEQHGTLSYTAIARPGPVYPDNIAQTGDPLFTHVVNQVALRFTYSFGAAKSHRLSGSIAIAANVQSVLGWRRTIPLSAPVSFEGDQGVATATLDISSLLSLLDSVEASTGLRSTYTLTLTPQVNVTGTLGGLPVHAVFEPAMGFSLNQLELQPIAPGGGAAGAAALSDFTRSAAGTAAGRRTEPLRISFGLLSIPVSAARRISALGATLIGCLIVLLMGFVRPRRRDESAAIRARYGGVIIPVERVWQLPGVAVIDVADIEALARIAAHYDRSILHERTDYGEAFWVTDESGQFRYWIGQPRDEADPSETTVFAPSPAEAPTVPLEPADYVLPDTETAPTLEFAAIGSAENGSGGWSASGHTETVEQIDGLATAERWPGAEPWPPAG